MTNRMPRVSIGLPVYNGVPFVENAISSILSQSFEDFELIICDNASTDTTEEVCRRFAEQDQRVRYVRNERNMGAAWNFNHAFALARGEFFKWAAADDTFEPEFLARSVEVLDRDPGIVLVYSRTAHIDSAGKTLDIRLNELQAESAEVVDRFRELIISGHSCVAVFGLVRRDALARTSLIGPFVSSDRVLLAQLGLVGRLYQIPEVLFYRRLHDNCSMLKHPSPYNRAAWFDPRRNGRPVFPAWRVFYEYALAVWRYPLRSSQRLGCFWQVARWVRFNWRRLANDAVVFGRHLVRPGMNTYTAQL